MGLDTSHGCWHGAYSAFFRWRNELAKAAGYAFRKEEFYDVPAIDWSRFPPKCLEGDWTGVEAPTDALLYLIVHSDCDGVIRPEQAVPLADRLEELLPKMPTGNGGGHIGDWRAKTQAFIDGLRAAAAAGESVDFH